MGIYCQVSIVTRSFYFEQIKQISSKYEIEIRGEWKSQTVLE